MMKSDKTNKLKKLQLTAVAFAGMLSLVACASTGQSPDRELQAAESAISNAEQVGVADFASPELNDAREKLNAARIAVQERDMTVASYLAIESTASAELASAKAQMIKSKAVNDEMQKSINTLNEELQRNTGVQQ
jgi:hypothetical protein